MHQRQPRAAATRYGFNLIGKSGTVIGEIDRKQNCLAGQVKSSERSARSLQFYARRNGQAIAATDCRGNTRWRADYVFVSFLVRWRR